MVFNVTLHAGIQLDCFETELLQASRYVDVPVKEQARPIKPNPYALRQPIRPINKTAGTTADGALPNSAIPLGNVKTPAPTIPLIKLKISSEIFAVPVPLIGLANPSELSTSSLSSAGSLPDVKGTLDSLNRVVVEPPPVVRCLNWLLLLM